MKDLSAQWAVAILVAPVILILGLALMGNPGHAAAAITPTNKAVVAIAFVSTFGDTEPVTSFQRITLNVIAVRLNPSKTVGNIPDSDSRWVTIDVPAGVGKNVGINVVSTGNTFGGTISSSSNNNNVAIGEGKSEIQIDLGAIQNVAEILNAQAIAAQTYRHVELVLNPITPGNVVPLCAQTFPAGEGCITYKAQFASPTPTPPNSLFIQTDATLTFPKARTWSRRWWST